MSSKPELLLDENLSWRVARGLREQGYVVVTTSEAHLTTQADTAVFRYAQAHHLIIVTRDDDFRTRFSSAHAGILIVHASNVARNAQILACLLAQLPHALAQALDDRIQIIEC